MKQLLASTAIALALGLAAPAMAQQDKGQGQDQSGIDSKVIEKEHAVPGQPALGRNLDRIEGGGVALVPSQDLTQRELKTADAKSAGKIAYVVVEGDTGQVSYLLTPITGQGDAGDPPQRFRVLPWDAVQQGTGGGQDLSVQVDQDQLGQMPEVSRDEFGKLQDESFRRQVDQSWQDRDQAQASAGQDQSQEDQGQGQDIQAAQVTLPPGHPPMLLVGPDKTEMIGGDGLPTAAVVVDDQGAALADLDHVVLDTAHGVVAYTILSDAGEAEKQAFRASPLSSLKWDAEKDAFVAPQSLKDSPAHASAEDAQASVGDQNELAELYEGSGVPPYWQPGQMQAEQPAEGQEQGQGEQIRED